MTFRRPQTFPDSPASGSYGFANVCLDIFILLVPIMQFVRIQSIGVLFGTDLMLLAALPVLLARRLRLLKQKQVFLILMLGLAWFGSQVVTDLVRESVASDYMRGWSKIIFTVAHFATIWMLIGNSIRRFVIYGVGASIGGALACIFTPTPYQVAEPWKFGLALPVTLSVVLLATWMSNTRRPLGPLALAFMSFVNLFMNLRSLGLLCLMAAVHSYALMYLRVKARRIKKTQMLALACVVIFSILGFEQFYVYAADNGWLGRQAQMKLAAQGGGGANLILGGRSEILASGAAILDSPILGHGSWPRDPQYAAILAERKAELGFKRDPQSTSDLIPTHSHILGAWVEAGILGAVFWIWVLKLTASTLIRATGEEPILPVFSLMGFSLMWDLLFSPYGAERRFMTTYLMVGIILFAQLSRQTLRKAR